MCRWHCWRCSLQVRQNSFLESSPGAAAEADQAILAAQVEDAISAAFSSLVDDQSCLMQEPCQQSPPLTLLQHVSWERGGCTCTCVKTYTQQALCAPSSACSVPAGCCFIGDHQKQCQHLIPVCVSVCWSVFVQDDDLAAAACGLTTGYVHGHSSQQRSEPAHASNCTQQHGICADWPFAARGLSGQDVDAIEQHMLQLVQLPGLSAADDSSSAGDAGSGFDPAVQRQLQQAELKVGYSCGSAQCLLLASDLF